MKLIPLTQGQVTLVDDENFEYLDQWKWYATKCGKNYCAVRHPNKHVNMIYMHRVIMKTPQNLVVDHIDHNTLNNQKSNLRNCTQKQNTQNKSPHGQSKYLGVFFTYNKNRSKYIQAQIKVGGKNRYLGLFKTEKLAAVAYDKAARKYRGEFANLNFK